MTARSIRVSVIVLTHDEEPNIAACLDTLTVFDEVIVVDSGSTDGTIDILRERFPKVRVLHHPFEDFGHQRNWALDHSQVKNDWVLFLDADERCTSECAAAIDAAITRPANCDGFFLCYRNIFLGRWIKRSTMFPTWQLRLLRRGKVRYRKEGHGQHEVMTGLAGYIHAPYDHLGFSKGVTNWIARHNEYSSNEVELLETMAAAPVGLAGLFAADRVRRHRARKALSAHLPFRPVVRFIYLYFIRLGCLDGRAGLIFCLLRMAHEVHIVAKRAEGQARAVSKPTQAAARTEPLPADAPSLVGTKPGQL